MKTTIDPAEVEQFSRIADEWWDPTGKFKPLHVINPLRVGWIVKKCAELKVLSAEKGNDSPLSTQHLAPLKGIRLLDIGCGGGLVAESMAALGAHVTAIDASQKNIAVAKLHAAQSGLEIDYRCTTAEDLLATRNSQPATPLFDVVLALEIVEHVADVELFVKSCAALVKPGGLLIMSTLNRTLKSYALAIIGAEYVLRWLPKGTHDWKKFLKPSELAGHLRKNGIELSEMTGMVMSPLTLKWELRAKDLDVNYLVCGVKK